MGIKERVQEQLKTAMKAKDAPRLECLRLVKAALTLKEKESGQAVSDEQAVATLRSEIRKRRQTIELLREHSKEKEAGETEREIAIIEEFLPRQLSKEELEERAKAYLADHPEITHPGKLTGALKKELGDLADGKTLSEVCKQLLEE